MGLNGALQLKRLLLLSCLLRSVWSTPCGILPESETDFAWKTTLLVSLTSLDLEFVEDRLS